MRKTIREAILDKARYYDRLGLYAGRWSGVFHSSDNTEELVDEVIREHDLGDPDSDDW